ncbi:10693_t:CDS:2 [Acaulospora colombiana]|uniref:10693_t:CDS:1 n=1 Tax=Acaulospora colombiana TaxID=27376 RepID=A0ACA9K7J0_9GLOM|nr:10693_t:CDS:2 [Acaulospora colombiana]
MRRTLLQNDVPLIEGYCDFALVFQIRKSRTTYSATNTKKMEFDEMDLTPISKLLVNLSYISSSSIPVVLITTGSMNPIHLQHVNMFTIAKRHLETTLQDHIVVAGYISPSQDKYVKSKLIPEETILEDYRIEMAKLATQNSSWIDVDTWESKISPKHFIDYYQVVQRLATFLNENEQVEQKLSGKNKIKVMYLCGSDHVIRTGAKKLNEHGLVIVQRKSGDKWMSECEKKLVSVYNYSLKDLKDFVFFVENQNDTEVSSTKIRKLLLDGKSEWEKLCDARVVKYMKTHGILMAETAK